MDDPTARQPVRERVARHRRGVRRALDDIAEDLAALRSEVRAAINLCAEQREQQHQGNGSTEQQEENRNGE